MKHLISHRGNTNGKNPLFENNPHQIIECLNMGLEVEIDVWRIEDKWFLGHDNPQNPISESFLLQDKLWCHAKNYDALHTMKTLGVHCFWHEKDMVTITSRGFLWAYPGSQPLKETIAVMPELFNDDTSQCLGICSDYILNFKENK